MEQEALRHNENVDSVANGTIDREAHSKFWIAAYTRPKSEKKAAKELASIVSETYVPTQTIIKQWSDRKKKVEAVVIPMIIFAKVTADTVLEIKKHHLIIRVVTLPGQKEPAQIPDKQISQLKFMLDQSDDPVEFEQTEFKELDKVRVVRGNLSGLEGEVIRSNNGQTKLVVSIDLLGGATVTINPLDLEIIND